ncbi:hypothetical protein COY32_04955 [candidate division WWE3 bacterium CG_4_10_14_0_2_um_filter_41_14]|uniref:Nudix hydrolase domain-containing protein n=1 Tax=candidate division WWE3 bacterium CG_4_10_14_0_2_um_filter_41_14 TaxID=1975072 RepID=A0A2M7THD6_UNCKA|nr:MAG: hypothetical protein COY32_04955 [candidate division WWE3 bacterium CG_4_10_14_0_2_um_filter_41_14]
MENNKLNFHLNQLKILGLIEKNGTFYRLTDKGKGYAGKLDTEKLTLKVQAKISVWVCCQRDTDNLTNEYLIYTRLKSPFYGCQGFMSGKVDYGETVLKAASRELSEETGLTGDPTIVALKHYLVFDKKSNNLLEDKFMFLCLVKNPHGEITAGPEGIYKWVHENQLSEYVKNPFEDYDAFTSELDLIKSYTGTLRFTETHHYSEKF